MAFNGFGTVQFADQYLKGANDIDLLIPKMQQADGGSNFVKVDSAGPWQLDSIFYNRLNVNPITIQVLLEYKTKTFKIREVLTFTGNNWFFQINQEFPSDFAVRIKTIGAQPGEDHAIVAIFK